MRACWVALLATLAVLPAGALEIGPLSVSIPADRAQAELWLDNPDGQAWTGQARLYRWEQRGDQEQLQPADQVAVSPARLSLAPGQRQRLRVVRLGAPPGAMQQGYRLLITPTAATGGARYSLPVFLQPDAAAPPASRLQVTPAGHAADAVLRLYNAGDGHAHLTDLVYVDRHGQRHRLIDGLAGYVLPHSTRSWALPPRDDGYAGGRFRARLDHAGETDLPAGFAVGAPSGL